MGNRVLECAVVYWQDLVIRAFNLQILFYYQPYFTMRYVKGRIVGLVSHSSRLLNYLVFYAFFLEKISKVVN